MRKRTKVPDESSEATELAIDPGEIEGLLMSWRMRSVTNTLDESTLSITNWSIAMPYRIAICIRKFSCSTSPNSAILSARVNTILTADADLIVGKVNGTAVGDEVRGTGVGKAEGSGEGICEGASDGKALGLGVGLRTHPEGFAIGSLP